MPAKTEQLQIRVTPQQKAKLKRLARAAGCDVSAYVLSRLPVDGRDRFALVLRALRSDHEPRFALAELNDFLHACPSREFAEAVEVAEVGGLSDYLQNYVAAMVELAAHTKGVAPPAWVREIPPLDAPRFATSMRSLRSYLLQVAPVPFKRRNIFVDASVGARV